MTAVQTYDSIVVDRDGPVGVVTLNRPETLNTWDWLMSAEMNHAFGEFDRDDDIRAIALTGASRRRCGRRAGARRRRRTRGPRR